MALRPEPPEILHRYKAKEWATSAAAMYGSELAGDIGNCEICERPWSEHDHTSPRISPENTLKRIEQWEAVDILKEQGCRLIKHRFDKVKPREYLEQILPEELSRKFIKLHEEHDFFDKVCAGCKNHHVETGGLSRHVSEMIGWCMDVTALHSGDWEGKVSKTDIIIGCYLHDFSKVWTYEYLSPDEQRELTIENKWQEFKTRDGLLKFVTEDAKLLMELAKYGIVLSEKQVGAVLFAEGGYSQANFDWQHPTKTAGTGLSDNPLATLVSMADCFSAFILGRTHR